MLRKTVTYGIQTYSCARCFWKYMESHLWMCTEGKCILSYYIPYLISIIVELWNVLTSNTHSPTKFIFVYFFHRYWIRCWNSGLEYLLSSFMIYLGISLMHRLGYVIVRLFLWGKSYQKSQKSCNRISCKLIHNSFFIDCIRFTSTTEWPSAQNFHPFLSTFLSILSHFNELFWLFEGNM